MVPFITINRNKPYKDCLLNLKSPIIDITRRPHEKLLILNFHNFLIDFTRFTIMKPQPVHFLFLTTLSFVKLVHNPSRSARFIAQSD